MSTGKAGKGKRKAGKSTAGGGKGKAADCKGKAGDGKGKAANGKAGDFQGTGGKGKAAAWTFSDTVDLAPRVLGPSRDPQQIRCSKNVSDRGFCYK